MTAPIQLTRRATCGLCAQSFDATKQRDAVIDVIRELVRVRMAPMTQEIPPAEYNAAWQAARELLAGLVVPK